MLIGFTLLAFWLIGGDEESTSTTPEPTTTTEQITIEEPSVVNDTLEFTENEATCDNTDL